MLFLFDDQKVARQLGKNIPVYADVYHSASRMPTSDENESGLHLDSQPGVHLREFLETLDFSTIDSSDFRIFRISTLDSGP